MCHALFLKRFRIAIIYVTLHMRWNREIEETLQLLANQVAKSGSQGPLIMCARCGNVNMDSEGLPSRKVVDVTKAARVKHLLIFLGRQRRVKEDSHGSLNNCRIEEVLSCCME